jgi:hypothetical protein
MTLIEQTIEKRSGVRNEAEFKRWEKRQSTQPGPEATAALAVHRLSQRTVKFIRWLKNHIDLERDWYDAITRLAKIYSRMSCCANEK